MKVAILGAKGMLGHDLVTAFDSIDLHSFSLDELDITNHSAVAAKLKALDPDVVVNAAAFTDVDACESNHEEARAVNTEAVKNLATLADKQDFVLVHFSTDYVFDGTKEGYAEDALPNPIGEYGKSKYEGEQRVVTYAPRYYLVRTAWLYGHHGKNFVDTILAIAKKKDEIEVVHDQIGSPTFTKDLAEAVFDLVTDERSFGTYHLTNEGSCSWFDFAKKILQIKRMSTNVKPITSAQLNRPAPRPAYSVLKNTKLKKLRSWQDALQEYLKT